MMRLHYVAGVIAIVDHRAIKGRFGGAVRKRSSFDEVITSFYEAATDVSLWPSALASLTDLFGPAFTSYYGVWNAKKEVTFAAVEGDHIAAANEAYSRYYAQIDPRAGLADAGPTGQIVTCHELFDDRYVAKSEFYQDFLIPIGGRYVIGAKLIDTGSDIGILRVHRNAKQGRFEHADRKLFARVEPHLIQAARLFHKFSELREDRARTLAALDRVPCGIIVVDQNANILDMNAAAEIILRTADALRATKGRLNAVIAAQSSLLHRLIHDACAAAGGEACTPGGLVRLDRSDGAGYLSILVVPLREATRTMATTASFGAVLFIQDSEARVVLPADRLRQIYGLTSAEATVAVAIAEGKTLDEIADANAVSKNTVRVQTQSILSKTGVRRQAELVRLLLTMPTAR
jgi:DNA-binding CsgD family transcriptional regulator/PAS domain-containing protein